MNDSKRLTGDKVLKENKPNNENDGDSKRLKVNLEFEDVEGFGDPDAYHK